MSQTRTIKQILAILGSGLCMIAFQNCGDQRPVAEEASVQLSTLDTGTPDADQDIMELVDTESASEFRTSAVADTNIPPVNYMYTRAIVKQNNYLHIRFRCPEVIQNGQRRLYKNFAVYFNGRYWYKFRSGCRSRSNSRSLKFNTSRWAGWSGSANTQEIRIVTLSYNHHLDSSLDDYSPDYSNECYSNAAREITCR